MLTTWLLRLGIPVTHGRPRHPQTQGKDERLHRTLQQELLEHLEAVDLPYGQRAFDLWRDSYNQERPHEALGLRPPGQCYRPSPRAYPEVLPPVTYPPGSCLRQVDSAGKLSYRNQSWRVGKAFRGQTVRLQPTGEGSP
ncbi:MAG TPA: integrase core domain-containing protein, partial [Armatimonadota bacterium]